MINAHIRRVMSQVAMNWRVEPVHKINRSNSAYHSVQPRLLAALAGIEARAITLSESRSVGAIILRVLLRARVSESSSPVATTSGSGPVVARQLRPYIGLWVPRASVMAIESEAPIER